MNALADGGILATNLLMATRDNSISICCPTSPPEHFLEGLGPSPPQTQENEFMSRLQKNSAHIAIFRKKGPKIKNQNQNQNQFYFRVDVKNVETTLGHDCPD